MPAITETIFDSDARIVRQAGSLGIVRTQELPAWFMDSLKDQRHASTARAGDTHRVCTVPAVLVDKWKREGFDVMREPARAIVARLKAEGYDAFVATNKTI